jgi:outer membrane protein assembly factor BamB
LNGKPTGTPQLAGDALYLFLQGPDQKGQLASIDLITNTVRWRQTADREWASVTPQIVHDQVLAGNCRGKVSAFSTNDGRELWSEQFQGCIRSIGTSSDLLYIGAQEGMLYAFAPAREPKR